MVDVGSTTRPPTRELQRTFGDLQRTDCDGMWIYRNLSCEFFQEHKRGNSADKNEGQLVYALHVFYAQSQVQCPENY